jgi:hypothetical protein
LRSTTHSCHLHYIAAISSRVVAVRTTAAIGTGRGGKQPRPLRPPRLSTPNIPRSRYCRARAHYHRRQIQPPCAVWRRGEGGTTNQPPRLPLTLRYPPRHRRLTDRSHLAVIAIRREEGNGEAGATEASCLPGRPSALHHSTPPSTRSRRARHITTTAGAKKGKEEQLRPLGLPGCPCDAAIVTPPSRCTTFDRLVHTTSTVGSGHLAPCVAAEVHRAHRPSSTNSSTAAKRPPGTTVASSPPRVLPGAAHRPDPVSKRRQHRHSRGRHVDHQPRTRPLLRTELDQICMSAAQPPSPPSLLASRVVPRGLAPAAAWWRKGGRGSGVGVGSPPVSPESGPGSGCFLL